MDDPGPGGFCDTCGHFAARHDESGCHFPRPADNPCLCGVFVWAGVAYPRPWEPSTHPAPTEDAGR